VNYGWVDLRLLRELHEAGFEVDYTDHHRDFSWERVRHYNVLVIYGCPAKEGRGWGFPDGPPYQDAFIGTVERLLEAGGGVFLMAKSANADENLVALIRPWGARIPFERLREAEDNLAIIPRMRGHEKLAFTDNVLQTPVSADVRQIWYPYGDHYNACNTSPIWVSGDWEVVFRGSRTSYTVPVDRDKITTPPPVDVFERKGGVKEPVLFAIRRYKKGRIAFCSQWPQFSIGQGTEWLYDRLVLSKGLKGRPSHFGRLIENTLRWLAEPSLASGAVGGYVTARARFVHPHYRPEARKAFEEWVADDHPRHRPPSGARIYRGLIGARTSLTSGSGTVADYARAATQAGLDFVVFLEDFEGLSEAKLQRLKSDCEKHSDASLQLFPGYRIDNNTGNHQFFYGRDVALPPRECLIGRKLNQQFQDPRTGQYRLKPIVLDWTLRQASRRVNVGYYHFTDNPRSQKLTDVRTYSAAGIRLYRDGRLVEDVTDDYLTCAQGTIPPTPVSVNLVGSPEALRREAASGHSLTYAQAKSRESLFQDALRWSHQYDGLNVFLSDGPMIRAWPACYRAHTYAAECFVTGRTRMPSLVHVTSGVGLKEIRIYNGRVLFRRFVLGGRKEFKATLQLAGSIQRNLVLIAEDVKGGKAVSFARRCWKDGSCVVFCGDHVNDGNGFLAKGPVFIPVCRPAEIFGGFTWDGGPTGVQPLANFVEQYPVLESDRGREGHRNYNALPLLEFADESVIQVREELDEVFDARINVANPWHTYGPIEPSKLVRATLKYTEFARPAVGPSKVFWPGYAEREGARVSLFEQTTTFKQALTIKRLGILRTMWHTKPFPVLLVLGKGEDVCEVVDVSPGRRRLKERLVGTGEWFGLYSSETSNSLLVINRGEPFRITASQPRTSIALFFWGDVQGRAVQRGQKLHYEFLMVSDPVHASVRGPYRFLQIVRYLAKPGGLTIPRGKRQASHGLVELAARDGAAELTIARPARPVRVTLPVRVSGLNPRWSAGLFQISGYVQGRYGGGKNRYRPAGLDPEGRAYGALFPDYAPEPHVVIGHPIVCDRRELFIQVTQKNLGQGRSGWHVSVNNPTDAPVTATFQQAMRVPGLEFPTQKHTIPAGGHVVLAE